MLTEEPFITIEQLLKRWPGMPYEEIGIEITNLIKANAFKKRSKNDDPFQVQFPQPFIRRGAERLNQNTGNIVWNVEPSGIAPYSRDLNGGFDLDYYCFKVAAIEEYEECHPEVFYQIVDADEMPEPSAIDDCIPALEAARQLKMTPVPFARYLRNHRDELPLVMLSADRDHFYTKRAEVAIEEIADMLNQVLIHRIDWENHLKTLAGPADADAAGTGEEAFKARLAEVVADYKAKLKQVETDLGRERAAQAELGETQKTAKREIASLKGQLGTANKTLERWQKALTWMIPAVVFVGQAGPKTRVRNDLKPFVAEAKGMQNPDEVSEDVYFEAWRAVLPGDYCDKNDKSLKKKQAADNPPTTGEPIDE